MTRRDAGSAQANSSWSKRFSAARSNLDLLILVLLAVMLLPLIIGPFFVVYEFMKAEAYTAAALVGAVFGGVEVWGGVVEQADDADKSRRSWR